VTNAASFALTTAAPRVAAGVLFNDGLGGILLVRPTYKPFWDLPGGYVEVGESPRQAAVREVKEELGIDVDANALLSVDWAPHKDEGDKLLFIFDGGTLSPERVNSLRFPDGEVGEARFVGESDLDEYTVSRLADRLRSTVRGARSKRVVYLEHGHSVEDPPEGPDHDA
jgi:8-oxo-dGTP diphosphatase